MALIPALACVALTTVLSTGCELAAEGSGPAASGSFDRTLQVNGPVTLSVTNGSGDVTIVPGQDGSVHVVGRIRASASLLGGLGGATADDKIQKLSANPPIVQEGSRIRIGEITDQSLRNGVTITYEIAVPVATQLKSRVGSGNETVGAIAGPVDVTSGSGDLKIGPVQSGATLSTGSGDIMLLGASGEIAMKTGSGDVKADHVRGHVTAKTGSGSITLDGQPDRDWTITAASGDVNLRLPSDARFSLDAHTASGDVQVQHALDNVQRTRHQVSGTANGGGARVAITTASGSVSVR